MKPPRFCDITEYVLREYRQHSVGQQDIFILCAVAHQMNLPLPADSRTHRRILDALRCTPGNLAVREARLNAVGLPRYKIIRYWLPEHAPPVQQSLPLAEVV